jgi:hypothetical protein
VELYQSRGALYFYRDALNLSFVTLFCVSMQLGCSNIFSHYAIKHEWLIYSICFTVFLVFWGMFYVSVRYKLFRLFHQRAYRFMIAGLVYNMISKSSLSTGLEF